MLAAAQNGGDPGIASNHRLPAHAQGGAVMLPSGRSVKYLKDQGYFVAIVERYIYQIRQKRDAYGWGDLLIVHPEKKGAALVQTTTNKNMSARLKKARGNGALVAWLLAGGRLYVHGWRKAGGRWQVSEREVVLGDILPGEGQVAV